MQIQFPTAVTPRQRAILHDIASKHGLSHTSAGEGNDRYILLSSSSHAGSSEKVRFVSESWRTLAVKIMIHADIMDRRFRVIIKAEHWLSTAGILSSAENVAQWAVMKGLL